MTNTAEWSSARYFYVTLTIVAVATTIATIAVFYANWTVVAVAALTAFFMSGAASDFYNDWQQERMTPDELQAAAERAEVEYQRLMAIRDRNS